MQGVYQSDDLGNNAVSSSSITTPRDSTDFENLSYRVTKDESAFVLKLSVVTQPKKRPYAAFITEVRKTAKGRPFFLTLWIP